MKSIDRRSIRAMGLSYRIIIIITFSKLVKFVEKTYSRPEIADTRAADDLKYILWNDLKLIMKNSSLKTLIKFKSYKKPQNH